MKYITGTQRSQINLFPVSLGQSIEQDNEVRLIGLFVNSLPLDEYGFKVDFVENGRTRYHSAGANMHLILRKIKKK
ncbi:MAG: hypothetical protein ACLFVR_05635 [Thiohalospira sp.]